MTLREVVQKQIEVKARLREVTEECDRDVAAFERKLSELEALRDLAACGLNVDRADLALRIVYVRGRCRGRVRRETVWAAMEELATGKTSGYSNLWGHSFKVKAVLGLLDRRDDYPYCYSSDNDSDEDFRKDFYRRRPLFWLKTRLNPEHLKPVFEVGLLPAARRELTQDEVEAALYYLEQVAAGMVG